MKVAAIIAEYNPLHNGHIHLINSIKTELHNDYTIVIMSGDYVERGEPASYNKELRAKWALDAGADLVILLPVPYALGSADLFAYGAVNILDRLNIVDYLCFGSESGDITRLTDCADILLKEGTIDSPKIIDLIKKGNTFAKARSVVFNQYKDLLDGSNNILALEYIMAIKKLNSKIQPYTIKRSGSDYNDTILKPEYYASASGIRNALSENNISSIRPYVSNTVYYDISRNNVININDFSDELYYSLLYNLDHLTDYLDVSLDLANRISNEMNEFKDINSFIQLLKTKNYTYSRISRCLMHIMLNIKGSGDYYKDILNNMNYIKVLGFNSEANDLMNKIKNNSSISLCTRIKDSYSLFSNDCKKIFDLEIKASNLYNKKEGLNNNEMSKQVYVKRSISNY